MFGLVIVWWNGEKQVYDYQTREDAEQGDRNIRIACGNQVAYTCVRSKLN